MDNDVGDLFDGPMYEFRVVNIQVIVLRRSGHGTSKDYANSHYHAISHQQSLHRSSIRYYSMDVKIGIYKEKCIGTSGTSEK